MQHRIALSCALGVALLLGAWVLYAHPPTYASLYPKCYLHSLTGLYCPGCGGTRCVSALLHLQPAEALRKNALVFVSLPFIAIWITRTWWHWVAQKSKRSSRPVNAKFMISLVVVVLLFGVLRNLPWEPFSLLAPR